LLVLFNTDSQADQKLHPLENYSVTYELRGNSSGTKILASRDYGRKQCSIEKSEMEVMGNKTKKNDKIIIMAEDGEQWIITINLNENTGTKMKNPMFKTLADSMKEKSPKEFSESVMKQMGGEKKGQKTVNGETCTEWTMMAGAYACVTDDQILLESGANIANISLSEVATDVKRNDPGPKGICDIGSAKIETIDLGQMMGQ